MRLEDGTDRSNGRVEICQYGIWGSVCSTEWDINDTILLCAGNLGLSQKVCCIPICTCLH